MNKHFINDGIVELIYKDPSNNNPGADTYDKVVEAETPARPNTAEDKKAVLKYDGTDLFWETQQV